MIIEALQSLALPIESINLDQANLRVHDDRNIAAIKASLEKFGQRQPIVVQRQGMVVRAGNGRVLAAKALGWHEIAAVVVDESDVAATAYAIADNRTAELAGWDEAALDEMLASLPDDIREVTGFTDEEMAELHRSLQAEGEILEDDAPGATMGPAVARTGDVWLCGRHRVLCGDSTDAGCVDRCIVGLSDTVTDPPYGIGYDYDDHDDDAKGNAELVAKAFQLAPGCRVWTPGLMNLARELSAHPACRVLVWHKGYAQAGNGLGGASTWEPVLCVGVKGGRLPNDYLHFGTDRVPGLRQSHPCPKPVALFAHLIEALTGRGVYDPFLGSGTTMIAAEQLGRTCYGIEISPNYVDVIVKRWQNLTGKAATLEGDGRTFDAIAVERLPEGVLA